ncbi:MAG: acyltransferase [Bacteroidota bacterium]
METAKVHFFNLDVLRFICAFAVAIAHVYESYFSWFGEPAFFSNIPTVKYVLGIFTGNLSLGVTMFFVISGFLITYLLLTEKQRFGKIHIGKFMLRRSLRIWPLYFLAIFIGYECIQLLSIPAPDYWANMLFWNNFNTINTLEWQYPFAHFWSISVEEHFYLAWPLLLFFVPVNRSWILALVGIIGSIAYRYYITQSVDAAHLQHSLYLHTLARIDEILVGALLACIHIVRPIRVRIPAFIRVVVYLLFIGVLCAQSSSDFWVWDIYSVLFKKYVYLFFIVFWMVNYLFNEDAFLNFKQKNLLHYLGKISFGIYIYHNMMIPVYINYVVYRYKIYNFGLYFGVYFLILLVISIVSYELFEKHFLKIKERFAFISTQR